MGNILRELDEKNYVKNIYKEYEVRDSLLSEYDELASFLKNEWKKNHIFVVSKEIFDFQHLDLSSSCYHFLIAKEKRTSEIHAVLGYVPTSHFDNEIERNMVWPCIWKRKSGIQKKGLGVSLYHYLQNKINIETMAMIGLSDTALSIYKHWNFDTGKMQHYVMPNFLMEDYLASGLSSARSSFRDAKNDDKLLAQMTLEDYMALNDNNRIFKINSVYKSKTFYLNRYLRHPVYKYIFLSIESNNETNAIIVCRACGYNKRYCLRIVDLIGDVENFCGVRNQLQLYIQRHNYEYVDFVEVGLDDHLLINAGFINRYDYDDVIVPNYFEPFLKKNIDLDYSYKTVVGDSRKILFKGDADQDRPNVLNNL